MKEKLLAVDYSRAKFKIIVTVCQNGNVYEVVVLEEGYTPTYQEIVGALEITKHSFISQQSAENKKVGKKQIKVITQFKEGGQ